jgi:hypothetical protein
MHKSRLGCLVIDCETDDLDREAEFLDTASYEHVLRRAKAIQERKGVQKGLATAL